MGAAQWYNGCDLCAQESYSTGRVTGTDSAHNIEESIGKLKDAGNFSFALYICKHAAPLATSLALEQRPGGTIEAVRVVQSTQRFGTWLKMPPKPVKRTILKANSGPVSKSGVQ